MHPGGLPKGMIEMPSLLDRESEPMDFGTVIAYMVKAVWLNVPDDYRRPLKLESRDVLGYALGQAFIGSNLQPAVVKFWSSWGYDEAIQVLNDWNYSSTMSYVHLFEDEWNNLWTTSLMEKQLRIANRQIPVVADFLQKAGRVRPNREAGQIVQFGLTQRDCDTVNITFRSLLPLYRSGCLLYTSPSPRDS